MIQPQNLPVPTEKQRFVFVQTFGCQMNVYDTDRMVQVLKPIGYLPTDDPSMADLVLLNTCSVRDKAEHKMMSALGRYARLKEYNDELLLGVGGCVASQEGERLLRKAPYLDLVFGPDNIAQLPDLVFAARQKNERVAITEFLKRDEYEWIPLEHQSSGQVSAMLTVMKGCNKFCSFCIVPFTRGREVSKPSSLVVQETKTLVESGVKEVMLLGQNVNSYGRDRRGEPKFPELLAMVNDVPGLERIRFTTSHPWDCTDDLIRAFDGRLGKLCEYFHLPVQSGSDTMLKKMRRGYTLESYLNQVEKLRDACPEISMSTDIIVGFPGETESQFEETINLLETVRFDRIFSFAYSERPNTAASRLTDDIAPVVKAERLQRVQALQAKITAEAMAPYKGKVVQVLVEGPSKHAFSPDGSWNGLQLTGRTRTNFVVNFAAGGSSGLVGQLLDVKITKAMQNSFYGELMET